MARPTVGILAGESSGDALGRGLMTEMKRRHPHLQFVGIGGPGMLEAGLEPLASMDRLAVNGLVEPIRRLPDLLALMRLLVRRLDALQPDVFVGVDFNVFNLLLERRLKLRGIPTVHYVSPSVYAWRRGRIKRVAAPADTLLTLYPFEPALYRDTPVRAVCVGHPLADLIPPDAGSDEHRRAARAELGLPEEDPVVALLPGSRLSEIRQLGELFLQTAVRVAAERPGARFVVPCVRPVIADWLVRARAQFPGLSISHYQGTGRLALTACDAALVKSGTSTLEAMLLRRPMVVSYRLGRVSHQIVRRLLRTPYVALPNILAGRELVPELLQDRARPAALAAALLAELDKAGGDPEYLSEFRRLHRDLARNADVRAADAVSQWIRPGT